MGTERLAALFALLVAAMILAWVQPEVMARPAGHSGMTTVAGTVSDKIIKAFSAAGISGVSSIEYRRLTMSPGARMEGKGTPQDHVELCIVEKGSVTITLADGSRHTYKEGDIFIVPKGAKETIIAADAQAGFVELYWNINLKGRH